MQPAIGSACEVVERVRDLLVDRAGRVLEFALDRERRAVALADAEDVDAAVLADDRLADADLAVDLQAARAEAAGHVRRDQVRVLRAASQRVSPSSARRPGSHFGQVRRRLALAELPQRDRPSGARLPD